MSIRCIDLVELPASQCLIKRSTQQRNEDVTGGPCEVVNRFDDWSRGTRRGCAVRCFAHKIQAYAGARPHMIVCACPDTYHA